MAEMGPDRSLSSGRAKRGPVGRDDNIGEVIPDVNGATRSIDDRPYGNPQQLFEFMPLAEPC
jgi:hypothetical protein